MYLIKQTAEKSEMTDAIFGGGFAINDTIRAVRMEIWGSSFKDPGEDFVEFRLIDIDGIVFKKHQRNGY